MYNFGDGFIGNPLWRFESRRVPDIFLDCQVTQQEIVLPHDAHQSLWNPPFFPVDRDETPFHQVCRLNKVRRHTQKGRFTRAARAHPGRQRIGLYLGRYAVQHCFPRLLGRFARRRGRYGCVRDILQRQLYQGYLLAVMMTVRLR